MNRLFAMPLRGRPALRRGILLLGALLSFAVVQVGAGVLVAPTVVFLSETNRTGRLNIQNPSNKAKEVSVFFSYGLPESDSLGEVHVILNDSNVTDPRSALDWVKAFPRKFVLLPSGSQVVRVVAYPPKGLKDGEYWARIVVRSQEGTAEVPVPGQEEQITTKLNMIMQTAIMLKYRTGDLTSELELNGVETTVKDSLVEVVVDMVNRGNVSYMGVINCRLLDADKRLISYRNIDLAVYRSLKRKLPLNIVAGDFKKPYYIDLKITSEGRDDIPNKDMIFGNEIAWSTIVD
jgi:P pilus assembly chaperone PapD